jgi:hypothetical protein
LDPDNLPLPDHRLNGARFHQITAALSKIAVC